MATRIVCDVCGKDISFDTWEDTFKLKMHAVWSEGKTFEDKDLDLCFDCCTKIRQYINGLIEEESK